MKNIKSAKKKDTFRGGVSFRFRGVEKQILKHISGRGGFFLGEHKFRGWGQASGSAALKRSMKKQSGRRVEGVGREAELEARGGAGRDGAARRGGVGPLTRHGRLVNARACLFR